MNRLTKQSVGNSLVVPGVSLLDRAVFAGFMVEGRMRGLLRHIATITLALGIVAQVPAAVCAVSQNVPEAPGCCVLSEGATSCCCGETASCEITPGRTVADPALVADLQVTSLYGADVYRPSISVPALLSSLLVRPNLAYHPPNALTILGSTVLLI